MMLQYPAKCKEKYLTYTDGDNNIDTGHCSENLNGRDKMTAGQL